MNRNDEEPDADDAWVELIDDGFIGLVGPFFQRGKGADLRLRFPTADKHRNRRGVLQGGALMTFADRALGVVARAGREDEFTATLHLDVHFIDAVRIGEVVETCPVIVRSSGQLVYVRAEFMVDSRVVALATGIWKKLGTRPA